VPRRGEYRPVVQAESSSGLVSRIGPRQLIVSDNNRIGVRTVVLDPGEFRCSKLVAELADEWVAYMTAARLTEVSAYDYRKSISEFARYTEEHCPEPEKASLAAEVPDLSAVLRGWWRQLPSRYCAGSTKPARLARAIRLLIRFRSERENALVAASLLRLLSSPMRVPDGRTNELDEFARKEKRALIRAAWAGVRAAEDRLLRGKKLLAEAMGHPQEHGWLDAGNLLWALTEGGLHTEEIRAHLPGLDQWPQQLRELAGMRGTRVGTGQCKHQLLVSLASLLYPRQEDLHAFRVLLIVATGHAPEEITGLRENDVEFTPTGVRLTLTKRRAAVVRSRDFNDRDTAQTEYGTQNVAELIRRLLALTERARADWGDRPAPLFSRAVVGTNGRLRFGSFFSRDTWQSFGPWVQANGLEISKPWDV
jgi:hypothetical protein